MWPCRNVGLYYKGDRLRLYDISMTKHGGGLIISGYKMRVLLTINQAQHGWVCFLTTWDRCLVPVNTLSLKIEPSAWFILKRLSTVGFTSTNRPSFGRKLNYLTKACMTQARLCGDTSSNFWFEVFINELIIHFEILISVFILHFYFK